MPLNLQCCKCVARTDTHGLRDATQLFSVVWVSHSPPKGEGEWGEQWKTRNEENHAESGREELLTDTNCTQCEPRKQLLTGTHMGVQLMRLSESV